MNPGRPGSGRSGNRVPKGVTGHSLGKGAARANAGKKNGCGLAVLAILSVPALLGWGLIETVRAVL